MARGIGTVVSGRRGGDVAGVRYGRGQYGWGQRDMGQYS
jgi:hypothetical protein